MKNKISLADLKSFYKEPIPSLPGNPNLHTKATKKNHIHVVNPSAKPMYGLSTKAQDRQKAYANYIGWFKENNHV